MGKYNIVHVNVFDGWKFKNDHLIINGDKIDEIRMLPVVSPLMGMEAF